MAVEATSTFGVDCAGSMSLPEPNSAEVKAEAASDTSGNEPEPLVLTVTVPSWAAENDTSESALPEDCRMPESIEDLARSLSI